RRRLLVSGRRVRVDEERQVHHPHRDDRLARWRPIPEEEHDSDRRGGLGKVPCRGDARARRGGNSQELCDLKTTVRPSPIKTIVITRSKRGNEELSGKLKRAGFDSIPVDTISLSPPEDWTRVDGVLRRLDSFDWLVFTSAVGVEYFAERMRALSLRLDWRGNPLVASVGRRTAEKLSGLGITTSFIPSSYLTKKLAEELPAAVGARVLLLRADIADPKLSEGLRARGFAVEETSIYRTKFVKKRTDDRLR